MKLEKCIVCQAEIVQNEEAYRCDCCGVVCEDCLNEYLSETTFLNVLVKSAEKHCPKCNTIMREFNYERF